jgi:hypothetical protein
MSISRFSNVQRQVLLPRILSCSPRIKVLLVTVALCTGRRCRLWLVRSAGVTQRVFGFAAIAASPGARLGRCRSGGATA